jgi:hypothetical protein
VLIALALGAGAAALGVTRGGSLDALGATRLRWTWLLAGGLAAQVAAQLWAPPWLRGSWGLFVVVVSNLAIVVFIAVNRHLPGLLLADLGLVLNLAVIVANGAMPVSAEAARSAGLGAPGPGELRHEVLDEDTALPWLGDVIPEPGLREVLSVGDLLLAAGIARLVYARTTSAVRDRGRRAKESRASG